MKNIIYGTAVAAAVMLSACEMLAPQQGTDQKVVKLTATIEGDTKTFLEWDGRVFKTRWAEEDGFYVIDRDVDFTTVDDYDDYCGWFEISSGVGESAAEFILDEGCLPKRYIAAYGEVWPDESTGQFMIELPDYQERSLHENKNGDLVQGFDDWYYPMLAIGEGKEVHFKNICSVLKINVTGNGEILQNVKVSSMDEGVYLAGIARLDLNSVRPGLIFLTEPFEDDDDVELYTDIMFDPSVYDYEKDETIEAVLSDDPIECYIVLPAQNYPSGLKVTLFTDEGFMEFTTDSDLAFRQSELREIPVVEYESDVNYDGKWRIMSDGNSVFMTEENGDYVAKDYNYEYGFSIVYGKSDYYMVDGYYNSAYINSAAQLQRTDYNENIWLEGEADYDIYLDPETLRLFVMSDEWTPEDIPTKEVVAIENYERMLDGCPDSTMVKIRGMVVADCTKGFVVQMTDSYPIYVHDNIVQLNVGDYIDLYATKVTYRSMPQLMGVTWSDVIDDYTISNRYDPEDITSYFNGYYNNHYSYISYYGEFKITENGYYDV